jgi:hypothetical protein
VYPPDTAHQSSRRRGLTRARAPRDADVDAPRRHLGVFLLAHEVELGRAVLGVSGELAHLVEQGPVADGVVDGGLPERMDADAAAAQPIGVDARGAAVLLDQPPGGLAVRCRPTSSLAHTRSANIMGCTH